VIATSREGAGRVIAVDVTWLELARLDSEIDPLPTDPAALEARRRERVIARIRARLDQPLVFDDRALDAWLDRLGVDSVTELMSRPPVSAGATLKITFGDGPDETPRRRRFPLAAALLIRDLPLSLAAMLDETRRVRPYLHRLGFGPGEAAPRARRSPIVAWVLPPQVFDDEDWPGASGGPDPRAERRRWAGAWLAGERIGLIVPPA
jgi:hypothetical protein